METYDVAPDRRTRLAVRGRSVLVFSVLALALPFTSWFAAASGNEAPPTRSVSYELRDLTTTAGVERIYRRLQTAAHEVCAEYDTRGGSTARAHQLCYDGALATAVARIDAPRLTERHAASESLLRVSQVASR
jgi:UrcA family protein